VGKNHVSGGKLKALACHLTKKVNQAEELNLSPPTNIGTLVAAAKMLAVKVATSIYLAHLPFCACYYHSCFVEVAFCREQSTSLRCLWSISIIVVNNKTSYFHRFI